MTLQKLAGAAALLCSLAIPGIALGATATGSVNVRNAPVNGAVVDVLRAGQQVEIDRCQSNGWCYVIKSGPDGWVSSRYLSNDDDDDDDFDDEDEEDAPSRPDVSIGFSVPGFSFQFGNGGFDIRPGRPTGGSDRVCFYERSNFRGASFCARPGERLPRLGGWNDRITSIDIRGNAQALVCEDNNFRGRCVVVSRDIRDLGRRADDEISSIRVR